MTYAKRVKWLTKLYGIYFWADMPWENEAPFKRFISNIKKDICEILMLMIAKESDDILDEAFQNLKYEDVLPRRRKN